MNGQKSLNLASNFLAAWFGTCLSTLIFASILLIYISFYKTSQSISVNYGLYQALPNDQTSISEEIQRADARTKIIEDFFNGYSSQLANHADTFIEVADKYYLDWRLLPAISMQESNGGKRMPGNSFNPFGYGIYGSSILRFSSFDDAIERVGKGLRADYIDKGLHTPPQIMAKYTPPSLEKGGAWAKGVTSFMEELK